MGRPIRNSDPEAYRLITIRTDEARLWVMPTRKMEKLIGGIIARYQEIFGIVIYAFTFLSNHYHLLMKAPGGNADEFLENVNREIARRINWKYHREGKFWGRRYDDQAVPTEEDLLEAFLYTTTNAVKHGLVESPEEWTDLSSYEQSLTETSKTYAFYHYSALEGEEKVTHHKLTLTPLPQFAGLMKKERVKKIKALIDARTEYLVSERRRNGQGFLGIEAVLDQTPGSVPQNVSRSPRPPCYSKSAEILREVKAALKARRAIYNDASMRFRLGNLNVTFPKYSYRPPLHRKPRIAPFRPMSDDFFKKAA